MAHHRPVDDSSYYFSVRQGNEDGYTTQQGKHQDVPVEELTPYTHPTSHCLHILNTSAPDDGRLHVRNLPVGPINTAGFSQVFEPLRPSPNLFFTSNDLLDYQTNAFNHSSFLNLSGSSLPFLGHFNPTTLNGSALSEIGFGQSMPATSVLSQATPFLNTHLDSSIFPESGGIGHCNEGVLIPINESPFLMNPMSLVEPLHNNNEYAPPIGNMLENMGFDQQINESNISPFATYSSQEFSSTLPYTYTASCGAQMDFSNDTTWDLGIGSQATMLPILPSVNIQSMSTISPPCIVAPIDRRPFLQGNTQSGLIRPVRAKNVVLQQDTPTKSSCTDAKVRMSKITKTKHPWSIERRISTAQMRKLRSCRRCRIDKVKCSKGKVCDHCQMIPKSPFLGTSCHRGHLVDYLDLFLPHFLVKHLSQDDVKEFTNPLHFTEGKHLIQVSTGRAHPLIKLLACRIIAPDKEFLVVSALTLAAGGDHAQTFATVKTLEYALRDYDFEQVKQKWRDHIEVISTSNNITGDPRTLRCKLLLIICRFLEAVAPISKENNILQMAIMMNRIQHIMNRLILIKEDSELNGTSGSSFPSARVLNRQLKSVLNDLQKEITIHVLQGLDTLLSRAIEGTWDICLCSFLVLCMCIEDLQVAIDLFIFSQASSESGRGIPTEQDGTDVCTKLEKEALENPWILLHALMKRMHENRHLFRHGNKMDSRPGRHPAKVRFWAEMSQLMKDHNAEISTRSSDHYQGGSSRVQEDHLLFRRRNEGRLTCIALQQLVVALT